MKISEAIEILIEIEEGANAGRKYEDRDAIKLGKEALEKIKGVREGKEWVGISLLPGETPDADSP